MNKKLGLFLLFLVLSHAGFSQAAYWQQKLDYNIKATLTPETHTIKADINLQYFNQSPDTLRFIWFHLWPNAYSNEKTALFKQLKKLRDRKAKLKLIKEYGSISGFDWKADGITPVIEPHPDYIDVVKLLLPIPLAPHKSVSISTPFTVKLPNYFSRSGFFENSFFVTQWYPKPAVYDSRGWHAFPYLDMGEFYSEFGTFHVELTVPSQYVVAATGKLENAGELAIYKSIGGQNYQTIQKSLNVLDSPGHFSVSLIRYKPQIDAPTKTLSFSADSVHDFAWFTDPGFIINYDTLQLTDNHTIDVFSYYQQDKFSDWMNVIDNAKDAVRYYSSFVGEYPFNSVSMVQGTTNTNSGGMEYPMITLITIKDATDEKMDAVITHEIGHNWFYCVLASNEREHAWMDEGINSFYQFRYEAYRYRSNMAFGRLPEEMKKLDPRIFEQVIYQTIGKIPSNSAIDKSSENYSDNDEYGTSVYLKAAAWTYALEQKLGTELFNKCMREYFRTWQFKHPYPEDMKKVFSDVSGRNLDDIFRQLNYRKQSYD